MKSVIFLNGSRGFKVFEYLYERGYEFSCVVTPPWFSKEKFSLPSDISHHVCENVNNFVTIDFLSSLQPDIFLIAGYSDIFKKEILEIPAGMTLNLHAGRLPEYRGGSPLNWQILNGEKYAGLSVIQVDTGIDTGAIVAETRIPIGREQNIRDLHEEANRVFPELVEQALEKLRSGSFTPVVQDEKRARYWHQRNDSDGHILFSSLKSEDAYNFIRAITRPYPGAWGYIEESTVVRVFGALPSEMAVSGTPGRVCFIQGKGPYVVCKKGSLFITEYEIEGDSSRKLKSGDRFF